MSQPTPRVLILHDKVDLYLNRLLQRFPNVHFEACRTVDELNALDPAFTPQVIFSFKSSLIPHTLQRSILLQSSAEWIQIGGAGFDHLAPLDELTVPLANSAGVLSDFMAEAVLGAILMINFGFHRYIHQQRQQIWQQHPWTAVANKTALIIGLGHIGEKVAQACKMMGMQVWGMRQRPTQIEGIDALIPLKNLPDVLPQADFVCLHLPLTPKTRHLIGSREFALMRPDAILINTARGGVVDERALIKALQTRQIAGAYLDVFDQEPLPAASPLWALENVVISPHCADSIADWEVWFADFFGDNLERWLKGAPLLNLVDVKRGY